MPPLIIKPRRRKILGFVGLTIFFTVQPLYWVLRYDKFDWIFFADFAIALWAFVSAIVFYKSKTVIENGTITTYGRKTKTMRLCDVKELYIKFHIVYLISASDKISMNLEWIDDKTRESMWEIFDEYFPDWYLKARNP